MESTPEDRDNAEEFANFLKIMILTADERTDFRMLHDTLDEVAISGVRYEARTFGRTIQSFEITRKFYCAAMI